MTGRRVVLACGHEVRDDDDDLVVGDPVVCYACPRTRRTNESQTSSWLVAPYVAAVLVEEV